MNIGYTLENKENNETTISLNNNNSIESLPTTIYNSIIIALDNSDSSTQSNIKQSFSNADEFAEGEFNPNNSTIVYSSDASSSSSSSQFQFTISSLPGDDVTVDERNTTTNNGDNLVDLTTSSDRSTHQTSAADEHQKSFLVQLSHDDTLESGLELVTDNFVTTETSATTIHIFPSPSTIQSIFKQMSTDVPPVNNETTYFEPTSMDNHLLPFEIINAETSEHVITTIAIEEDTTTNLDFISSAGATFTNSTNFNFTSTASISVTTSPTFSSPLTNKTMTTYFPKMENTTFLDPQVTGTPSVTYASHKPSCNSTDGAVVAWLGFPVFWWAVLGAIFILILMMMFSLLVCLITSRQRWRKKNSRRRGYLDDQLTTSFIQTYSNPEVTPSSRNNKNRIPPKPKKDYNKSSYPKSYHLGPKLLPFPADAVRLKPSNLSSAPSTPLYSDNVKPVANGGKGSTEDCHQKNVSGGLRNKILLGNTDQESTFGSWMTSGMAGFGGFLPGYKRTSASNLINGDSADKKLKKSNTDDEVFDETEAGVTRDGALTTFCYKNNITNTGSTSTFKS